MRRAFSEQSPYKKLARFLATLWTLLILLGCLAPSKDLPEVNVPLIDKWTHFVFFGGFTFLWLCAYPKNKKRWLFNIFFVSVCFGCFIEIMQGALPFLGRSSEVLDILADSIGGALGVGLFSVLRKRTAD
jgi:VanZ family protein